MAMDTLTRADLTEAVFQAVGLSRTDSAQMVETCSKKCAERSLRGRRLKLSSFGTILRCVRSRDAWVAIPKPATRFRSRRAGFLVFRPSHVLKAVINGQAARSAERKLRRLLQA